MPVIDENGEMLFPIPMSFQARIGWLLENELIQQESVDLESMPWLARALRLNGTFDDLDVTWNQDTVVISDSNGESRTEPLDTARSIEAELLVCAVLPRDKAFTDNPAGFHFAVRRQII